MWLLCFPSPPPPPNKKKKMVNAYEEITKCNYHCCSGTDHIKMLDDNKLLFSSGFLEIVLLNDERLLSFGELFVWNTAVGVLPSHVK